MAATTTDRPTGPTDPTVPHDRPTGAPNGRRRAPALAVACVLVAVATVAWGCYNLLDVLALTTTRTTTTYAADGTLRLHLDGGGLSITRGRSDRIVVHRKVVTGLVGTRGGDQSGGDVLDLGTRCSTLPPSDFCDVSYDVEVPAGTDVLGSIGSGSLRAQGVDGRIDVNGSNGSMAVSGNRGDVHLADDNGSITVLDVTGDVDLSSDNGNIRAQGIGHDGTTVAATSDNGNVKLVLTGAPKRITTRTDNGSVEVTLPADAPAYAVSTEVGNGTSNVTIPTDPGSSHTLEAATDNGSIRIHHPD